MIESSHNDSLIFRKDKPISNAKKKPPKILDGLIYIFSYSYCIVAFNAFASAVISSAL